jgi:hypothetical protein
MLRSSILLSSLGLISQVSAHGRLTSPSVRPYTYGGIIVCRYDVSRSSTKSFLFNITIKVDLTPLHTHVEDQHLELLQLVIICFYYYVDP